jgi:hypothetical protein
MLAPRACSDPQAGGASDVYLVGLFERLGIAGSRGSTRGNSC